MSIIENIKHINQQILQAEISYNRLPGTVTLVAVSKGHSCADIELAFNTGLRNFGESYLQEAEVKIKALITLPICWHFLGPIQSNKSDIIAHLFSWVHSIDRRKIAQRLNDARPTDMARLNVCLQVNLDNEQTKSGLKPEAIEEMITFILQLPRLHLRGLMVIPKQYANEHDQYLSFLRLKQLLDKLNQKLSAPMDTLSMGMSHDFQAAIRAGSTMVRVGTGVFGERSR